MDIYRAGEAVTITLPFVNEAGAPVAVTAGSYQVIDESNVVIATGAVDVSDPAGAAIVVADTDNTLAAGVTRGYRQVVAQLTTAGGTVEKVAAYIIEGDHNLVIGQNSFQTLGQAELMALDMPECESWRLKGERDRMGAMVSAYWRFARLRFDLRKHRGDFEQSMLSYADPMSRYIVTNITDLTAAELALLPAEFTIALRRAQLTEADTILGGDLLGRKRRSGLMSETIGESSMMFRTGKPVDMGISPEALRHLKGYITYSVGIGRA